MNGRQVASARTQGKRSGALLSLKGRALRLLSLREHTHAELAAKLAPHCESPDELPTLLAELSAKGWLDDRRAMDSLVHRQAGRYGAARIRQVLQVKGVSPDLVADALSGLADTELARATAVWRKKFSAPAETPGEQARQIRFLLARGFSPSLVRQVVAGAAEHLCDGGDQP